MRPRLLDLFCKAGGAGKGYADVGFEVVGVDIERQKRYPYEFHQGDAIEYLKEHAHEFDVIHASPPCQAYSDLRHRHPDRSYPDLVPTTRAIAAATGLPYVIENVPGAPLENPIWLCGTHFGLQAEGRSLKRHRGFESNVPLKSPGKCSCRGRLIGGVYGHSGGGQMGRGYKFCLAPGSAAMGIDWMTVRELAQAIPPAYTRYIGVQLMAHIKGARGDGHAGVSRLGVSR